jgi:hypothetical protein
MIQYANATPAKKQKEVYIVIFPAQRLSFSYSPGAMNFHS